MFKKIKLILVFTPALVFIFAVINTWKDDGGLNNHTESFEKFLKNDSELCEIERKIEGNNMLFHPKEGIDLRFKKKIRIEILRLKYNAQIRFLGNVRSLSTWIQAFLLICGLFFGPFVIRAIFYWIVAPFLQKRGTIQFFDAIDTNQNSISIPHPEQKNFKVQILPNESLYVVDESFVNGFEDDKNLKKSIRWLFSWKYPIMSFCCGLRAMNKYDNKSDKTLSIDITSDDPDDYFIEIDLKNCKGAFILPSSIKAFSPTLGIRCKWRLMSSPGWCMLRLRYYIIYGSGKIILSSNGGFSNKKNDLKNSHRRKPNSLIFADSTLKWDVIRTEHWYPYIIGKTQLFDLQINGDGKYLIKNILSDNKHRIYSPESFLNVIGKLFGF